MGKMPTKAKRGKRRWIGLEFKRSELSRESALDKAKNFLGVDNLRLFDLVQDHESGITKGIVEVKHDDLDFIKSKLESLEGNLEEIKSVTMSGKIRLVRSRMGIVKSDNRTNCS